MLISCSHSITTLRLLGRATVVVLSVAVSVVANSRRSAADDNPVRFNQDVRPILSENCYHCHGPDEDARTADLRLDIEQGAKEYAIVEGDASASELIDRITSDDPDLRMPPPDSERRLSASDIETLTRWVNEGAAYEAHWSFITPERLPPPDVGDAGLGPIDRFVIDSLNRQGLKPSGAADRTTLIRRATFDLIGLPPTLDEIDAFVGDTSEGAYGRLIDRLLTRKEFGERMASDWLDVARYSDTYGYQVDRDRYVWPWRDWVINALNQNMPYDQFVTLQLAGDLVPDAGKDERLATTFNRLHPQKVEGGSVPEEFRMEYVADRTQTVATAFMGLTMECCRCHNHKYDPLSQKEYYELSAFFDKIDEAGLYSFFTPAIPTPTLPLPTPKQQQSLADYEKRVKLAEQNLADAMESGADAVSERLGEDDENEISAEAFYAKPIASLDFEESYTKTNLSVEGVDGKAIQLTGDDSVGTKVGNFRRFDPFSVSLWIKTPDHKDRAVIFHRSRAWTDAASRGYQLLIEDGRLSWSLIHFWPGNAIRIRTTDPLPLDCWVHVAVTNDGSSRAEGLEIYVNGERADVEIVRDRLTKQITGGGGDNIAIGQRFRDRGFKGGSVDLFRVYDQQLTPLEVDVLAAADKDEDDRIDWPTVDLDRLSAPQRDLLLEHRLLRHEQSVDSARDELRQARERWCEVQDKVQEIMVMRASDPPRQSYLLARGAYDNRAEPVDPGTPSVLNPFPEGAPRNRLGLAKWLTDPSHPLTARVAVNRLWQICFGSGLVRTPEDFGSQGEPPTHPELLDWLASDFVDGGWDVKRTLKQIMMSETYRRSSRDSDPRLREIDPENRWLARFPSYRLPAEMLRDNSLAVSGRLVNRIGGPPVRPYEIEASFKPGKRDKGDGLYRRSLYTYWKRTGPAPAMMALDASKRDVCRVRRERTSSPIQAFVLLNGPQYVEAARGLAERMAIQHGDNAKAAIQDAFRILTSRPANDVETDVLMGLYNEQHQYFDSDKKRTDAYLSVGDDPADESLDGPPLAALTVVIGTLMNFDQSVMKR